MKPLSFSPARTPVSSGWRSLLVASFICALAVSARSQSLTQAQIQQAFYDALLDFAGYSSGEDWSVGVVPFVDAGQSEEFWDALVVTLTAQQGNAAGTGVGSSAYAILEALVGVNPRFSNLVSGVVSPVVDRLGRFSFRNDDGALYVANPDFRFSARDDLYVHDRDLEDVLSYVQLISAAVDDVRDDISRLSGSFDSSIYGAAASLSGDLSGMLAGPFDVVVQNWPDYYDSQYDAENHVELMSYQTEESSWDQDVFDSDQSVVDMAEDVDGSGVNGISAVTNAVAEAGELDYDDQADVNGSWGVRDQIFEPISARLVPSSVSSESFSSDVLILPAVPRFGIPRLEYSFSSDVSEVDAALSRIGGLMSSFYDVLFSLFVVWLIWHEYNFYFRSLS